MGIDSIDSKSQQARVIVLFIPEVLFLFFKPHIQKCNQQSSTGQE